MQLRNCSAEVNSYPVLTVVGDDRTKYTLHDAIVLTSYKSHVAVYSKGKLYLLPRHNYSRTTWIHLRKFIEDYCDAIPSYYKDDLYSSKDVIMCEGYTDSTGVMLYRY